MNYRSDTGGKWRRIASLAVVLFFVFSIAWQTRASADQSMAEQLLDIMRANHQISAAQYRKLKKRAQEQNAAQKRTEEDYKRLKRQVEEQKATSLELKEKTDEQSAAIARTSATTEVTSGKKLQTYEQQRTTGTGGSGGGMNFNMHGISVNVGGFIEAAGMYRSRWLGADIDSPYQNLPLGYSPHAYQDETRFSARQSRLSVLAQGDVCPTVHLAGYYEMDFLGAAQSANSNESNSYNMRIRHLFATADWDTWGLHLLGGQSWSLVVPDSQGIIPRKEEIPLTIDAQYVPGFSWTRQPQFRLVKDWEKTFWLGVSVENPATTVSSEPYASVPVNYAINQAPASNLFASNLSVNNVPDIIEKAAYDSPIGHFEVFNLTRNFESNLAVGPTGGKTLNDQSSFADAVGGTLIVPICYVPGLKIEASSMYGDGIGRYGSGQLPDVTQDSTGAVHPITALHFLGNLTWSPCKEFTLYAYYGVEQAQRNAYDANGKYYGYGNLAYDTLVPGLLGTGFQGQIQSIQQFTVGDWWKCFLFIFQSIHHFTLFEFWNFYNVDFFNMVLGLQYSYTTDKYFSGTASGPQANDNMFFSSLRYYWN
jgi:hypothetical protein